jgi:hypothetical protein
MKLSRLAAVAGTVAALLGTASFAKAKDPANFWSGHVPFCDGIPQDCTKKGFFVWMSNAGGCITGTRFLCVSVPRSKYKAGSLWWSGYAPFCDGIPSDCHSDGMDFIAYGYTGDGALCWWGTTKALCAKHK